MNPQCKDCKFYIILVQSGGAAGNCRRHPPTAFVIPNPHGGLSIHSDFPTTKAENWCGEFKIRIIQ